jgi:predicted nucleic acid-binding Zn ribbon protein
MAKRTSQPTLIGQLLTSIMGTRPEYVDKVKQYQLWGQWPQVVGEQIAQHAKPVRMRGKTLVVAVENASWMQELTMMRLQILTKVQQATSSTLITDIRFVMM